MSAPVLVVENDLGCAERLRGAIQEMGGSAHIVTDGLEALRWLRSARPSLILVDQGAAWVDGFRICRLVKFHARMRQIPVIIMTAVPDAEQQRLAEAVKADGYVEKRQGLQAVLEAVRRLLTTETAAEGG